jgi:predicted ATP-grasp superfamily ATP-dependent carboligase
VRTGREPILLANAGYYGTLAAARSLGRAGVEIITADPSFLCPARYSCHVRRHLKCPDFEQVSDWAEWLLRLGRSERHSVVYATSDAVSFALALYRDELSRNFALYQPHIDTIISILDKGRLLQRAAEAGFDTPATWLPKSPEEAGQIARSVGGKFLVKPRSQLAQRTFTKGYVARAHEVPATFNQYIANANRDSEFGKAYPESLTPLLQQYYPEALSGIYSLSGFRDRGGRLVVKAARKVLQRPRQVGVGVCFEGAPLDPGLVDCTARLCEHIGYYGVFELEFVTVGSKSMLIDFNGRFYNQIRLDVARGMDLPRMAYAAAMGLQDEVSDLMSDVAAHAHCDQFAFCNGLELSLIVGLQRVCRTMSAQEAQQWRSWSNDVSRTIVDSVRDGTDPMPHFIDMAQHLAMAVRHPRSFIKQYGQLQ